MEILNTHDKQSLLDYLLNRPLVIEYGNALLVHAGIPPQWDKSEVMKNAEIEMKKHLMKIQFKKPKYPIISNYDAKCSENPERIFDNLSNQMSNKVKWVESIKYLESMKETNIIEIGPGKVLTGLIKRISNQFTLSNINSIKDLENIINGL